MMAVIESTPTNFPGPKVSGPECWVGRIIVRTAAILALGLLATGCGGGTDSDDQEAALPFKARLSTADRPRAFTVSVAVDGGELDEVRESVRFAATEHCLFEYGSSDTEWDIDSETGDWAHVQGGGGLVFSGRCTAR